MNMGKTWKTSKPNSGRFAGGRGRKLVFKTHATRAGAILVIF